jgi:hypothetical protein
MSDDERHILQLVEIAAKSQSLAASGRIMVVLIKDYIVGGDLVYAKALIGKIEPQYYDQYLYRQAAEEEELCQAVAKIIDVFGLGWTILSRSKQA